jgi:hypothetical protein
VSPSPGALRPLVKEAGASFTSSGITPGFPGLCRSWGQVTHALLPLSPLDSALDCSRAGLVRLACLIHAANVRSEPGSNPSKKNPKSEIPNPKSENYVFEFRSSYFGLSTLGLIYRSPCGSTQRTCLVTGFPVTRKGCVKPTRPDTSPALAQGLTELSKTKGKAALILGRLPTIAKGLSCDFPSANPSTILRGLLLERIQALWGGGSRPWDLFSPRGGKARR